MKSRPVEKSISARLCVALVISLAAVTFVMEGYLRQALQSSIRAELDSRMQDTAMHVARVSEKLLFQADGTSQDRRSLQMILERESNGVVLKDMARIEVLDAGGHLLVASSDEAEGVSNPYYAHYPIRDARGGDVGAVRVRYGKNHMIERITQEAREAQWVVLAVYTIVIILVTYLTVYFMVLRPVQTLNRDTHLMRRTLLDKSPIEYRDDEIGTLAQRFAYILRKTSRREAMPLTVR